MNPRGGDLPHRFPFRLVERAERTERGTIAVLLGTAGGFLTGVVPWPVTLVAEALAQSILLVAPPQQRDSLRLVGMSKVALSQPISAGDRIEVAVEEVASLGAMRRFACRALRGGALVAVAEITVSS